MKKYKCSVCGYIYDTQKGDAEAGIKPGTTFDELPEDWTCPLCRVDKSSFVEIDDENVAPQNETRIEEKNKTDNYDDNPNCGTCEI